MNKSTKKQGHGYRSHTERYRDSADYRATCAAKTPHPTPEWLVYASGKTAREDGESGDEFPH